MAVFECSVLILLLLINITLLKILSAMQQLQAGLSVALADRTIIEWGQGLYLHMEEIRDFAIRFLPKKL